MKRRLIFALLLLAVFPSVLPAQTLLRYNYKKNGYVYTGSERIRVVGSGDQIPVQVKLGRVAFPDGAAIYILHLDFEDATSWTVPQNAPLTLHLNDGKKSVVSKNTFTSGDVPADNGIKTSKGVVYWNPAEYYFDENDIRKIVSGVKSLEAVKRWSTDGKINLSFKNDEFADALAKEYHAIVAAAEPKEELGSCLRSIQDENGSRFISTNVLSVNSKISVSLSYIYFAETNNESYDLNIFVPDTLVPSGADVLFKTFEGEEITLHQEKPLEKGLVVCYPDIVQLKAILSGVSRITISTDSKPLVLTFQNRDFSRVIDKLYNAIQTAAVL